MTSSEKQVELAIQYGATAIMTTGDYLLRLADAAEKLGYDVKKDLNLKALSNIGDADVISARFGAEYFATYGCHEIGNAALECPAHDGLHIMEDAFIVQILDVETGERLPDGELGAVCLTEICKTGSPQFRYNIMDLSYLHRPGQCDCGSWLRRMAPFAGRGDNMVKLRGLNLWPEGVGEIACSVPGAEPDYFVTATRENNRDELTIAVVSRQDPTRFEVLRVAIEARLQQQFGLKIAASVVRPGALDELTKLATSPKPKCFCDDRAKA